MEDHKRQAKRPKGAKQEINAHQRERLDGESLDFEMWGATNARRGDQRERSKKYARASAECLDGQSSGECLDGQSRLTAA